MTAGRAYGGGMRLTKFGHSCVRIEHEGTTVVLDPGAFTEPEAVDGADAVLITHVHPDHYTPETLRRTDAPVHTIGQVARAIRDEAPDVAERVSVVTPGQGFEIGGVVGVGGVGVEVVNEQHAVIHPDYDRFDNSGYLLTVGGTTLFHPGDSLEGPGRPVDLLLLPVSAPWLKIGEAIDFAVGVGAPRNLAIHDKVYSDLALGMADGHLRTFLTPREQDYVRLADGADL